MRVLSMIRRTFVNISKDLFAFLYKTYVRPHLEYCASIWSPSLAKDIDVLEKVQKWAMKMVTGLGHWPNVFRGLDSQTGLVDWIHTLSWKQLLNNNPGIIHLLQHWRHHYRATTADTALPVTGKQTSGALMFSAKPLTVASISYSRKRTC